VLPAWRVLVFAASIHAAAVVAVLALNVGSAFLNRLGRSPLDPVADLLAIVFCLPLLPLVHAGRLDLFFVLLPVNTFVYAVAAGLIWLAFRRLRGRRRAAGGLT